MTSLAAAFDDGVLRCIAIAASRHLQSDPAQSFRMNLQQTGFDDDGGIDLSRKVRGSG